MKKYKHVLCSVIALSVAASILAGAGCRKLNQSSASDSTTTDTVPKETTEVTTTEDSKESSAPSSSEPTEESTEATSEETSEDTSATESTSETTSDSSSSGVKAHWDAYQGSAEKPEPVVRRIQEDPIEDFVPSSDYRRVLPFCGITANEEDYWYDQSKYGFIDADGRLICDPIYSEINYLDDGYIVSKYTEEHGNKGKFLCGFLSADGSFYSGAIYDTYQDNGDLIYLFQVTDSGISYVTFDRKTSQVSEAKNLKLDLDPDEIPLEGIRIKKDRYIAFIDDYGFVFHIYDGKTGKEVPLAIESDSYSAHPHFFKNVLYYYIYGEDGEPDKSYFYTIDGELLYENPKFYSPYSSDTILLERTDDLALLDEDGNATSTIPKDSLPSYESIVPWNEYYLFYTSSSIEVYDQDFKPVQSIPTNSTQFDDEMVYSASSNLHTYQDSVYIRLGGRSGKTVNNFVTGKAIDIGSYSDADIIPNTDLLLLSKREEIQTGEYEYVYKTTWEIVDAESNTTLLSCEEAAETLQTLYDTATSKTYLFVKAFQAEEYTLYDLSTGEKVFSKDNSPFLSGTTYAVDVYDESFLCRADGFTYMINRNGEITFLNYTITLED